MAARPDAHALIELALDTGSFTTWDQPLDHSRFDAAYRDQLDTAQRLAGTDESIITGRGRIHGRDVAVIVGQFSFLGGSIGHDAATRVRSAVERATRQRLPVFAAPATGGTRMQEGVVAFVEMIPISAAVMRHRAAGLPYMVYLRHPTTGGVLASWGSQAHMTAAEPGALIGFLGPKVYQAMHGEPFPKGIQVAENLVDKGIIDAVVPVSHIRDLAGRTLRLLTAAGTAAHAGEHPDPGPVRDLPVAIPTVTQRRVPVWEAIQLTRRPDRPGLRELLRYAADEVIPLSGTGSGERGHAVMLAVASFGGMPCVVVGHDRRPGIPEGPGDLRVARRGMRLAQDLGLPMVTVVDTDGADLSRASEEGGLAAEIARSLADKVQMSVPSVSVLLGRGGGGTALALVPADVVLAAEHAWLSPLPPEGASMISHGDTGQAGPVAEQQRVGSLELADAGIVSSVIAEPVPAHENPAQFCRTVGAAVVAHLRNG